MNYEEMEQKKKKALRWVGLAFYVVVVVLVAVKAIPIVLRAIP